MAEKPVATKMRENVDYLRKSGAPKERIAQEINYWKGKLDQQSAEERKLSGIEKVAAVGSKLGSGATFGLLDEAAGLFGDTDTQRFLQDQLEEENPALAFGAEVLGGLAVPGSFLKAAPKAASFATKAGRVLGEGAIQGAASGIGNARGGLEERVRGALAGGLTGGAASGAMAGVSRGASTVLRGGARRVNKNAAAAASLEDVVQATPRQDLLDAQQNYQNFKLSRLGDEATMADVLPGGSGMLRAQRTANKAVADEIDTTLGERSNRLANKGDERFSEYTGTERESVRRSVADLDAEAQRKAKPFYDAAEGEALAFEQLPKRQTAKVRAALQDAVDQPSAAKYVERVLRSPQFKGMKPTDHLVMHEAYKQIGHVIRNTDYRSLPPAAKLEYQDLVNEREALGAAMDQRALSYKTARKQFAEPKAHANAIEAGNKKVPADMVQDEMAKHHPSTHQSFKQGTAMRMRGDLPPEELGKFAHFRSVLAPIATREKIDTFREQFGEDALRKYLNDVIQMAKLQGMKAGRGESTTADKVLEQMQTDPNAIVNLFTGMLAPSAVTGTRGGVQAVFDVLGRMSMNRKKVGAMKDVLMRTGEDVPKTLDEMLQMRSAYEAPGERLRAKHWGRGVKLSYPDLEAAIRELTARQTGRIASGQ